MNRLEYANDRLDEVERGDLQYSSAAEFLWIEVLGGCGCGDSEDLQESAWYALASGDSIHEVLAHWMDSNDLLEHGTSIYGSWISPKGQLLLDRLLKQWGNK